MGIRCPLGAGIRRRHDGTKSGGSRPNVREPVRVDSHLIVGDGGGKCRIGQIVPVGGHDSSVDAYIVSVWTDGVARRHVRSTVRQPGHPSAAQVSGIGKTLTQGV